MLRVRKFFLYITLLFYDYVARTRRRAAARACSVSWSSFYSLDRTIVFSYVHVAGVRGDDRCETESVCFTLNHSVLAVEWSEFLTIFLSRPHTAERQSAQSVNLLFPFTT